MDDRDPGPRASGDASDLRLGRAALALLDAARGFGDPALIVQAEAMALAAGLALAERVRAPSDDREV
ncbi:hypothetical protein Q8W71_19400 [Methylobacterium sp. NEAU 140]|uniref:hypothetical protein n=1 Tax=Methylobacterium sp. NEAU 140 TaxID=3064945 RepID=UPI002733964C|nr:hypothetical protein [Methylobacterium sp. NEAU 140]MDP4024800.1 hypothetical protein [Methylobacterium sp. NEAU 140]